MIARVILAQRRLFFSDCEEDGSWPLSGVFLLWGRDLLESGFEFFELFFILKDISMTNFKLTTDQLAYISLLIAEICLSQTTFGMETRSRR